MQPVSTKLYVLFNSSNRQFVGWSFSPPVLSSNLLIREVRSAEPFNLQTLKWDGDYDTGKLVDTVLSQKADVRQSTLIEQKHSVLLRAFPPVEILEILIQQIAELTHKKAIRPTDLTEQMAKLISIHGKVNSKMAKDIAFYQQSPDHNFITLEQENAQLNNAFATSNVDVGSAVQ